MAVHPPQNLAHHAPQSKSDPAHTTARLHRLLLDDLSAHEREVIESVLARTTQRPTVARDVNRELHESRTVGERVSDGLAEFGGSWTFILLFMGFLGAWTVGNTLLLGPRHEAFDPYPYIFLNLLLSMIAALQAPVIMMSQNRAAKRDRLEAKNDYDVNRKAELEIRELHDKLDTLRESQWAELVRMQQDQIRLLQALLEHAGERGAK